MSPVDPQRIAQQVAAVRAEIAAACQRCGRDPAGINLIAVTKSQGPEVLDALRACGIHDFGENRIDHLEEMRRVGGLAGDRWHFIGRVQSRQLQAIAPAVFALHSLHDPGHLERLDRACQAAGVRLPVFLQVNASGETSKAGIDPAELGPALAKARSMIGLEIRGLMTMAPDLGLHASAVVRDTFRNLRLMAKAHGLDRLSMGMSGDFAIAIEEGATEVRVGSRLFQ
jgi:pyridoxal phosphate enzyme (YggS family)